LWVTLAATALVAACNNDGGSKTIFPMLQGERTRATRSSAATTPKGVTNATVSWAAPTENSNGTAVGPLGGYKIYYGTASRRYAATMDVSNPDLTTYMIDNLEIGVTYCFAVAAVPAGGVDGALSAQVAVQIS
jgi:hypothetical protein